MVQDLLPMLPQEPGRVALIVAILGTLIGLCSGWQGRDSVGRS